MNVVQFLPVLSSHPAEDLKEQVRKRNRSEANSIFARPQFIKDYRNIHACCCARNEYNKKSIRFEKNIKDIKRTVRFTQLLALIAQNEKNLHSTISKFSNPWSRIFLCWTYTKVHFSKHLSLVTNIYLQKFWNNLFTWLFFRHLPHLPSFNLRNQIQTKEHFLYIS